MIYDINLRTRTNHASNENDAKACYDRIVTSLMSLVNRVNTHAKVITQAKFYLMSLLGTSTHYYTHSADSPIYGTGQGSGDSPNQWAMISSIILDIMHQKAHKATFHSPSNSNFEEVSNTAFVDDISGYENDHEAHSTQESIQTFLQKLEDC